jgi:hypothetical protein
MWWSHERSLFGSQRRLRFERAGIPPAFYVSAERKIGQDLIVSAEQLQVVDITFDTGGIENAG